MGAARAIGILCIRRIEVEVRDNANSPVTIENSHGVFGQVYKAPNGRQTNWVSHQGLFIGNMSFEKQAGVLQMVWYAGSIDDNTATTDRAKTTALLGKEPSFEGVLFDGTVREEPGNLLRGLRWSSFDVSAAD